MKRLIGIIATVLLATMAISASASADSSVYWMQESGSGLPGAGTSLIEPEQMIVFDGPCGGCGYRLVNLTWQDWGAATTTGTGKAVPLGGPGTCGYPPKGCQYPNVDVTVYLSNITTTCGESRYTSEQTLVEGQSITWPDVDCQGDFKIPKPAKPKPDKPKHTKPKRKRLTSYSAFNKMDKVMTNRFGSNWTYSGQIHGAVRIASNRYRFKKIGFYYGDTYLYGHGDVFYTYGGGRAHLHYAFRLVKVNDYCLSVLQRPKRQCVSRVRGRG